MDDNTFWAVFWVALFSYWAIKQICYYCFYSKREAVRDIAREQCRQVIIAEIDTIISAVLADIKDKKEEYIFRNTKEQLEKIEEIIKDSVNNE